MTRRVLASLWAGLATLALASAAAAATRVERPYPARGHPDTVFYVPFVSFGSGPSGGYNLEVVGPSGTRCSGVVALFGRAIDEDGRLRLALDPCGRRRIRAFDVVEPTTGGDAVFPGDRPMKRWCPGTYRARLTYETSGEDPQALARGTFRVRP
jgi:hypothetical protein